MPSQPRSILQSIVGTLLLSPPAPVDEFFFPEPSQPCGLCLTSFCSTMVQDAHKVRQAACFVQKAQWTSLDSPCAFPALWNNGVGSRLLSCYLPLLPAKYAMRSKRYSYLFLLSPVYTPAQYKPKMIFWFCKMLDQEMWFGRIFLKKELKFAFEPPYTFLLQGCCKLPRTQITFFQFTASLLLIFVCPITQKLLEFTSDSVNLPIYNIFLLSIIYLSVRKAKFLESSKRRAKNRKTCYKGVSSTKKTRRNVGPSCAKAKGPGGKGHGYIW